ncbi:ribosome-assembly protein 3-domain-containing protein [Clohesyomyces aquaticus]|uniref:Ribosome assembly protein 3 n=1 Tax=Clohesyomyces aquaticus TaxID=1231657 RepID=A0A1Y1Y3F2_9PLEO|nr:ribosome-assembly protein 3-domain-containing protein [Clohesyomyces aquaticus]
MAIPNYSNGAPKPKRSKKRKSRTEVILSDSESDIDTTSESNKEKSTSTEKPDDVKRPDSSKPAKKEKKEMRDKKEKKKSKSQLRPDAEDKSVSPQVSGEDVTMTGQDSSPVDGPPVLATAVSSATRTEHDFASMYLRKVTIELADDLDKVREANDFTNRSMPMLIHALRQGESIFGAEEKRRVISAANVA